MKRTALVAGATGLVGSRLLARLLRDPAYTQVVAIARQPLGIEHPQLRVLLNDYADLTAHSEALAVDHVFCCLGTTLKRAGSREAFADVDERMVLDLARATREAGAEQFLLVSAVGASEHALSFYSRTKGRVEQRLAELGFDALHILRPSLLLGERREHRPFEALAQRYAPVLAPLCVGPLRRYRPVSADEVAEALVRLALRGERGQHVHHLPLANDGRP